jgi:hypothetical protein
MASCSNTKFMTCQVLALLFSVASLALAKDKAEIGAAKTKYEHRYAEILENGLLAGYCRGVTFQGRPNIYDGIALEMSGTDLARWN